MLCQQSQLSVHLRHLVIQMDPLLKELTRLEKLTAANGKGPSVPQSLDSLLWALQAAKEAFLAGNCTEEDLRKLAQVVEAKKKEVDERQKEVYNVLSRFGKALDKAWLPFEFDSLRD